MMSGLEAVGAYFLGVILGGVLGFVIARRLYRRPTPTARRRGFFSRWKHRRRQASGQSSQGIDRSRMSGETEEAAEDKDAQPAAADSTPRVPGPVGATEHQRSPETQRRPHARPQPKRGWMAPWLKRRTVEAEAFVVRDATGIRRAKLGMSADGWVRLRLFDEGGERCVSLGVAPDGHARLRLYDQHGESRAGLAVFPDNAGEGLVLNDQVGNPRLTVSLLDNGAADLRILDASGKVLWKAP